jgi:hypothetical protein
MQRFFFGCTVSSKDNIIDVRLMSIFFSQTFIAMSSQCLSCCESVYGWLELVVDVEYKYTI